MSRCLTLKNEETGVEADVIGQTYNDPRFDAVIGLFHELSNHKAMENMKLVFEYVDLICVWPGFGPDEPAIKVTFNHPTLPIKTYALFPYDCRDPGCDKGFIERSVEVVMSTLEGQEICFEEKKEGN